MLFGQVFIVLGIVVAGISGTTQWTAAQLDYPLRLGTPWFDFLGVPIYHPWRLFEWWCWFEAYAPRIFLRGGAIAATGGIAACCIAIGMSIWLARQPRHVTTYGSVRWTTLPEIRSTGLANPPLYSWVPRTFTTCATTAPNTDISRRLIESLDGSDGIADRRRRPARRHSLTTYRAIPPLCFGDLHGFPDCEKMSREMRPGSIGACAERARPAR